ncbi:MAG TPA: ABC transporter ATP-binding protein [Thermotogota bacterium]|nr:ABC transporter ATP-binding protein [Thermotogota bacterium]
MESMIRTKGLSKNYGSSPVLQTIDISIRAGERIAFLGPSGCGKTTLLRCLSGLINDYGGEIESNYKRAGFVFQENRLIPWCTLQKNMSFVSDDSQRIESVLEMVGLTDFKNHHPSELSGGMKQRANLARALIIRPDIIFFDEPFQSLDLRSKINLMGEVKRLQHQQKWTAVLVTHGIREAVVFAHRIIILSKGPAEVVKIIELSREEREADFFSPTNAKYEREILDYYE